MISRTNIPASPVPWMLAGTTTAWWLTSLTVSTAKVTASTTVITASTRWISSYPKTPTRHCSASTMTTAGANGMCSSDASASPPNSPTRPSQAMEDSHCTMPGRATPPPNASLDSGSCAVPVRGPHVDR